MTYCITSRRGTSKLLELVPNPFDDINKICSKQNKTKQRINFLKKKLKIESKNIYINVFKLNYATLYKSVLLVN